MSPANRWIWADLDWVPERHGKQLWEIGSPESDRRRSSPRATTTPTTACSLYMHKLFPNDVNYIDWARATTTKTGSSSKCRTTRIPKVKPAGYNMGTAPGRATPWTITFDMAQAPQGKAHLRIAIAATSTRQIDVVVNDQPVGKPTASCVDGAIARNGITGVWSEKDVPFDASALKAGTNSEADRTRRTDDFGHDLRLPSPGNR